MKIGFDAKRLFFNRSGLGSYGRATIDGLARYNPENEYLLYTPQGGTVDYVPPTASRVVYPDRISGRLSQAYWRAFGLAAQLRRDPPDIFHGFNNELPFGIARSGCRTVMTVHDLIPKRYPHYYHSVDLYVYDKKSTASRAVADLLIADSQQTRRDLMEFCNIDDSRIRVVPLGCDRQYRIPCTPEAINEVRVRYSLPPSYVLCVGTIETRKNQRLIIDGLAASGLDTSVVLVGRSTTYIEEVLQAAKKSGLSDRLHILNNVPFSALPALYAGASVFAYPSRFEGFGLPVLEAICMGVPVIAATGSCLEEPGGSGSLYVDPDDVEAMGEALRRAFEDTDLRAKMIMSGHAHAENFTEVKVTSDLMAVYRELCPSVGT